MTEWPSICEWKILMNCPVCKNVNLMMTERQGIEIDYCPTCRGVWLDRGELDKLIDKAAVSMAPSPEAYVPPPPQPPSYGRGDVYDRGPYRKKRKGMLSELFDFD